MKKITLAALSVLLAGMFTLSLAGCTFFVAPPATDGDNPIVTPTPDDPDEGETPVDPDEGETPVDPDEGETPTDPDEGETPTDPDEGETPVDPDEGETPVDPDEGETPVDPDEGETPVDPDEGETPVEPDEGETPTDPDEGETPTDPDEGETPTDPDEGETPVDPDEGETPVEPDEGETPTDPDEGETPVDPDEGETPVEDGSTELYLLYQDAKKDGYTGTFVDFLKELGIGSSEEPAYTMGTAVQSVVSIRSVYYEEGADPTLPDTEPAAIYSGAGVIYSLDKEAGDAYIITNYHVLYEQSYGGFADEIRVYLYGQYYYGESEYDDVVSVEDHHIVAEYVGGAMDFDIAVIRIENSERLRESAALACEIADSDELRVGETVYAIGNPDSQGTSVTRGIVSVPNEYISIDSADESKKLSLLEIRVDAAINHGNSGGGLFNEKGQLIGIVNARLEGGGINDFGYAIPVNQAVAVAHNILDNAEKPGKGAYRAMLGITSMVTASTSVYDEETGVSKVIETLTIVEVSANSPADGVMEVGDILKSVRFEGGEEVPILYLHTLTVFMFNVRLGDTVVITYERDGVECEARFTYDAESMFTLCA